MRRGRLGFLAAAATAAGLLMTGAARAGDNAPAKDADAPPRRSAAGGGADQAESTTASFPIIANLATLKPGAKCRVELKPTPRGGHAAAGDDGTEKPRVYEGVVTEANEKGVGLALTKGKQFLVRRTPVGHAPILDRIYHGAGAERPALEAMTEVWLPSKSIVSVHLTDEAKSRKRHLAPAARLRRSR